MPPTTAAREDKPARRKKKNAAAPKNHRAVISTNFAYPTGVKNQRNDWVKLGTTAPAVTPIVFWSYHEPRKDSGRCVHCISCTASEPSLEKTTYFGTKLFQKRATRMTNSTAKRIQRGVLVELFGFAVFINQVLTIISPFFSMEPPNRLDIIRECH